MIVECIDICQPSEQVVTYDDIYYVCRGAHGINGGQQSADAHEYVF